MAERIGISELTYPVSKPLMQKEILSPHGYASHPTSEFLGAAMIEL
jgi:hypothetical protein